MDKIIRKIQGSQYESDMWQDEASHSTLDQTNSVGREKEKKKRREKEKREAPTSLYNLWRLVGRFSSDQELKIIFLTKAMRGYRKHKILSRIQVKSLRNQGFWV